MCKAVFSSSHLQDAPSVDEIVENYKILLAPPNDTMSVRSTLLASLLVQPTAVAH